MLKVRAPVAVPTCKHLPPSPNEYLSKACVKKERNHENMKSLLITTKLKTFFSVKMYLLHKLGCDINFGLL